MKDIKSLYLTAKSSGTSNDIAAYTEAVNELLESDPIGYMSNLEYIISSSIGVDTWGSFVEKYGLPIACYDYVVDVFESCIEKAETSKQDTSVYEEAIEDLEDFREKYNNCFMMYDQVDLFEEKSHSKLKYSFRMAVNIKNGHMIKIVFDLNPSSIKQIGDHTRQYMRDFGEDRKTMKKIQSIGSTDFSSKGTVKAIVDLDTKKQLKEVTTIGIVGNGGTRFHVPDEFMDKKLGDESYTFTAYPVSVREKIAAKLKLNPPDAITFRVGETEKIPSYKSTLSANSASVVYNNEFRASGRGVDTKKGYFHISKRKLDEYNSSNKHVSTLLKEIEDEYNSMKNKISGNPDAEEDAEWFERSLAKVKKKVESQKNDNFGQVALDARYYKDFEMLEDTLRSIKRSIKRFEKKNSTKSSNMSESVCNVDMSDDQRYYIETYYSFNDEGLQNKKLLSGMIQEFGEMAIADLLITADQIGENAVCQVLEYTMDNDFTNPLFTQCMLETVLPMSLKFDQSITIKKFLEYAYDFSYQSIVDNMIKRNTTIIQEAVLTESTDDAFTYYTEEEIDALTEYITFKEYQLVYADPDNAMDIFNEICSLYEQLDGIITESGDLVEEDVADNILPQLPINGATQGLTEAPWLVNTMNKKTGNVPTYIGRNHDLNYGEDDKPSSDDTDPEDFKRPSAIDDTKDTERSINTSEDDGDIEVEKEPTRPDQSPVNNYYYYTYNNSLNKNSHSFNKDSENTTSTDRHDRHDSHDRYDKHDDHSSHSSTRRTTDDHSTGKRINSNDYNSGLDDVKNESKMPWELDLEPTNTLYTESAAGVIFGTILLAPIALAGIGMIYYMIDSKIAQKKYKKEILSVLSEMTGEKVTSLSKYETKCEKEFKEFLSKNNNDIFKHFYKFEECRDIADVDLSPAAYFTSGSKGKDVKVSKSTLILCSSTVAKVLVKKSDIRNISDKLNKLSSTINVGIVKYCEGEKIANDLPGDDNGGDWGYLIKAGICDGGPENCPDDKPQDYINKQIDKINKSGYVVVDIILTMSAESLINQNSSINESVYTEDVGDADNDKPESDHPIKDAFQDIDRNLAKTQQKAKKKVQDIQNVGRAITKPVKRTNDWITKMVMDWKDKDETRLKEKMADPHARKNLYSAIKSAIAIGAFAKAGLLLNPIFLVLGLLRGVGKNKREYRIRNEMIGELKAEREVIKEKIEDARRNGDNKAKYRLMRLDNEINKKLLRVGGSKGWKKII